MLSNFRRILLGTAVGESAEEGMRRLSKHRWNPYILPMVPAVVDLYDRIAVLEARVEELSLERSRPKPQAPQ